MMATTKTQPNKQLELTTEEMEEVNKAVREIRGSTGWGTIEIIFQSGDLFELDVSVKRKLKFRTYER